MWQFAGDHPVAAFFLAWLVVWGLITIWNRTLRCINIRNRGWPPEHCDADGDFRRPESEAT